MADPTMGGPWPELSSLWKITNPTPIKITQQPPLPGVAHHVPGTGLHALRTQLHMSACERVAFYSEGVKVQRGQ